MRYFTGLPVGDRSLVIEWEEVSEELWVGDGKYEEVDWKEPQMCGWVETDGLWIVRGRNDEELRKMMKVVNDSMVESYTMMLNDEVKTALNK